MPIGFAGVPAWLRGLPIVVAAVGAALAEAWSSMIGEPYPAQIELALTQLRERDADRPYWRRYF